MNKNESMVERGQPLRPRVAARASRPARSAVGAATSSTAAPGGRDSMAERTGWHRCNMVGVEQEEEQVENEK